ncbi:MAG TPA: GAF domain-containing protein, partial [Anaerolineales bacterium]|nr:GAF domain-containing protein [Anaerolineales bacterium]
MPQKKAETRSSKPEKLSPNQIDALWYFERMDLVNRAMQGTNDLEQMMKDLLDTLLDVFDCDRAFLVYPCNPDHPTWQVPMERTRPEFPGVLPIGVDLPLDPVGAEVYRILRKTNGPVKFGDGEEYAVPVEIATAFSVQAFIAMAFYPKVGDAWSFGLHQCSHPRVWSSDEERLFQEVG